MRRASRCIVAGWVAFVFAASGCGKLETLWKKKEATPAANPAAKPATKPGPAASKAAVDGGPLATDRGTKAAREVAPEKAWTPPAAHARGTLFSRLPRTSLFALRLPDVSRVAEAYRRSALSSLLGGALFAGQRTQIDEMLAHAKAELLPRLGDPETLLKDLRSLKGEFVLAIPSFDFSALAGGAMGAGPSARRPAFTIAALYQAGASAETFQALLDQVFALSQTLDGHGGLENDLPVANAGTTTWLRRRRDDKCSVTLARDGDLFSLTITTYPPALAASQSLSALPLDESFNAADLVRATQDSAAEGGKPVAELFVNLAPVWSAVALALPPDAKEPLTNSGLTSIGGISLTSSLSAKGLDESFLFHSPGGRDLLSRFCASRPLVSAVTRWLPADFANASIFSLDFAALFDGVRGLVPAPARKSFDDGMAQMRKETGIDLRGDVFGNVGPTFAVASHGSFENAAAGGEFEWICAIDLQDAVRARRALEKFLRESGLASQVRNETIEEFAASSTELPPIPTPVGSPIYLTPAWLIDEHSLVLASKPATLRKAAVAAKESHAAGALRVALDGAGDGAFAVSLQPGAGEAVATTVGRRTPAGLLLSSRDGNGTMTTGAAVWAGAVGAAVALPKMLEGRVASNEGVAVETLRAIWKAEIDLRTSQMIDLDNDGKGEFGTLAELAGSQPMRGRAGPAPLLDASFAPDAAGVLLRGGYLYRVDLPTKTGGGVSVVNPRMTSGAASGPTTVSNDLAEQQFVAYAWPALPQGAGSRAFVIDATGAVYFTKNDGEQQNYSTTHAPKHDAALLRDAADKVKGVTAVRRGHDDGIWLEYR